MVDECHKTTFTKFTDSQIMKLGAIASHPIQYQAPLFRNLSKSCDLTVYFCHSPSAAEQGAGFGSRFEWDIDLKSGYQFRFLKNIAKKPGLQSFFGCDTPEVKSVIETERFDAFLIQGWHLKSFWQAVNACKKTRTLSLIRGDSHLLAPRSRLKRFFKAIAYPHLIRQFDRYLYVGVRNREYLQHYGAPNNKMHFAPHFVDREWFENRGNAIQENVGETREKWGGTNSDRIVLFSGKLQSCKRPSDLIFAIARLPLETKQRLVLVFVGSGELQLQLEVLASEHNVRCYFAGFMNQSQMPLAYRAADVLVLPSESETWGLVVNEAMASGCPAFVSDAVGSAPDMIDEGRTGATFPVGDIERLSTLLIQLSLGQWERTRVALDLAKKSSVYSVETATRGILEAVRSTVQR